MPSGPQRPAMAGARQWPFRLRTGELFGNVEGDHAREGELYEA